MAWVFRKVLIFNQGLINNIWDLKLGLGLDIYINSRDCTSLHIERDKLKLNDDEYLVQGNTYSLCTK